MEKRKIDKTEGLRAYAAALRALATAWEARCRLAIGLLEDLKGSSMSERWTREQATEALAAIGQLPPTNQKDQS